VKLTIHFHLAPRLIMRGSVPPFPLHTFMAFTGTTSPCFKSMLANSCVSHFILWQAGTQVTSNTLRLKATAKCHGQTDILTAHNTFMICQPRYRAGLYNNGIQNKRYWLINSPSKGLISWRGEVLLTPSPFSFIISCMQRRGGDRGLPYWVFRVH